MWGIGACLLIVVLTMGLLGWIEYIIKESIDNEFKTRDRQELPKKGD